MKRFFKVTSAIAVAASLLVLCTSQAFAVSEGQIAGGNVNYKIKDLTQNSVYANPASANSCDVLEYKALLYNTGPSSLYNVNVVAALPSTVANSNTSTMTASSENADPASTSFSATVNLSSAQNVSYLNGTTQLLNVNNGLIENLPDGITQGGVNIGTLGPSVSEFIQFETKVSCPVPAPVPQPVYTCNLLNVTEPATKQINADVQYTAQNGAAFKNVTYNFGDGSTPLTTTNTTANYTYAQYGKYNITATVGFIVNGSTVSATSPSCAKTVSFTAPPVTPQPVYTCNLLNVTKPATKQIDANVQYTAQYGAAFKNVTYNFGDGSTPLTTTNTSVNYTYAQYGTYNITATVAFFVNGKIVTVSSPSCAQTASFVAPTVTPPILLQLLLQPHLLLLQLRPS